MDTAITLKDAGLILIGIGIIILIFYSVIFLKQLILSVKYTNEILEDTKIISKIAADRTKDLDKAVGDITSSVSNLSEVIKGNQNMIAALTSIVNALASLKNIIKKR